MNSVRRLCGERGKAFLWIVLLLGMAACEQDRPLPVADDSPEAEVRLQIEYFGAAPGSRAKSLMADEVRVLVFHLMDLHEYTEGNEPFTPQGKIPAAGKQAQDVPSDFWKAHDPDDWDQWPQYVRAFYGFNELEVDQKLRIEGNLARGTLKVRPGEKFLLVGVFAGGELVYQGEGWILAFPEQPNQAVVEARPFVW